MGQNKKAAAKNVRPMKLDGFRQFGPSISVGSEVALDIVPIPETPYKYEARKIIFEDGSKNSLPDRKVGFISKISHKKGYAFIKDKELGDAFFHFNDVERSHEIFLSRF